MDKLIEKIIAKHNPTVMGLDPLLEYVPEHIRRGRSIGEALFKFNRGLIDCTADLIPAIKPQSAYYELYGLEGIQALHQTISYAREAGLYVILDAKRGDIGSTAEAYAGAYLGIRDAGPDCITVNPYLGSDGVLPFTRMAVKNNKDIFVLVKTSNKSSGELQDIDAGGEPLYRRTAALVREWGDTAGGFGYNRCGAVVGATYPAQIAELRAFMPETFFLIPGYGAQGGKAADIAAAFDKHGLGAIVNSSRGLMCAYQKAGDDGKDYQKYTREAVIAMRDDLCSHLPPM